MGNKMVEFASEDRSSRVGSWKHRQNDQHVRRRSACVEIMRWHEMYLTVKKITRIAVNRMRSRFEWRFKRGRLEFLKAKLSLRYNNITCFVLYTYCKSDPISAIKSEAQLGSGTPVNASWTVRELHNCNIYYSVAFPKSGVK